EPILDVDIGDTRTIGSDLLRRIEAQAGTVTDIIVDPEPIGRKPVDEAPKRRRSEVGLEEDPDAVRVEPWLHEGEPCPEAIELSLGLDMAVIDQRNNHKSRRQGG